MVHAIKLTRRATSAASIALKAARTRRAMQPAGRPRTRGAKAAPAQADGPNEHEDEPDPTRGKYKRSDPTFRRPREVPGDTYDYIQDTDDDKKYICWHKKDDAVFLVTNNIHSDIYGIYGGHKRAMALKVCVHTDHALASPETSF